MMKRLLSTPFIEEHFISKRPQTIMSWLNTKKLMLTPINGHNCLLSPEIGFWEKFCKTKLPNSRFLIQEDEFAFMEIIRQSNLPCFSTNLSPDSYFHIKNRINIPITDADAHATFYIIQPRY